MKFNPKLLGLTKYLSLKVEELTPEIVAHVASAFDMEIDPTAEVVQSLIQTLRSEDIDKVADLLGRQDVFMSKIAPILARAQKQGDDDNFIICPHCDGFIKF